MATEPPLPPVIVLRPVIEADLPVFFDDQRDSDGCGMAGSVPRDQEAFAAHWAKTLADAAILTRTILADGHVAGYVASFDRAGQRELGYWVGKAFWKRGVATAALGEFLMLEERRPLLARVAKRNAASLRVLTKCWFTIVGEDRCTNSGGEQVEEFVLTLI
jgi:RimJ/RimL family protein N-acetyltransferase